RRQRFALAVDVAAQGGNVDPGGVVDGPGNVADRDHLDAPLVQLLARHAADVAEPLLHGRGLVQPQAQFLHRLFDAVHDAAAGGLAPPDAPAQLDRLARHDLRTRVPDLHTVRVVNPGHRLFVGPQVRGHHVNAVADYPQNLP